MAEFPEIKKVRLIAEQAGLILLSTLNQAHEVRTKGFQDVVTEADHRSEAFILSQLRSYYPTHAILTEESGFHHHSDPEATIQNSLGSEDIWFIDPLDGTMNFAHNVPFFCTSIGYAHKGELVLGVIHDPVRRETFYAAKGKGAFYNDTPIQVSSPVDIREALLATGFNPRILEHGRDNIPVFAKFMELTAGVRRMGSAALEMAYVASGRLDGMWELALHAWDVAAGIVIAREAGALVTDLKGNEACFKPPFEFLMAVPEMHAKFLEIYQSVPQPRDMHDEN